MGDRKTRNGDGGKNTQSNPIRGRGVLAAGKSYFRKRRLGGNDNSLQRLMPRICVPGHQSVFVSLFVYHPQHVDIMTLFAGVFADQQGAVIQGNDVVRVGRKVCFTATF